MGTDGVPGAAGAAGATAALQAAGPPRRLQRARTEDSFLGTVPTNL